MKIFATPRCNNLGPLRAKMRLVGVCVVALAAALCSSLLCVLRAGPPPAATLSPAATVAAPLDALDAAALRPHINEEVAVRGTPTGSGHNKAGTVAYLDFASAHQGVSLVFFLKPGQAGKPGSEDDLKPFVGKAIVVTGKLTDYKGDLQIVVDSLDQIKTAP